MTDRSNFRPIGPCMTTEMQQAQGTHPWAAVHTLTYVLEGGPLPAGQRRPSIVAMPTPLRPAVSTGMYHANKETADEKLG